MHLLKVNSISNEQNWTRTLIVASRELPEGETLRCRLGIYSEWLWVLFTTFDQSWHAFGNLLRTKKASAF